MEVRLPNDWRPRSYQKPLWAALDSGIKRACAVWHRRAGKDLTLFNYIAVASQKRVGTYFHVSPTYAQGRKIIWEGIRGDGRRYLDAFPGWRDPGPGRFVTRVRDDEMSLWLANGSRIQVIGADDVDRLIGVNPVGLAITEYSVQDPRFWEFFRPILAENDGWACFISTPRGRNHLYKLLQRAKESDRWFTEVLTVDDTARMAREFNEPIPVTQDQIDQEREDGMDEALIAQEFMCSFDAPLEGAFYGDIMKRLAEEDAIGKVPYEPSKPVITAWDIGVDDYTAIVFAQRIGREIRIIDYYQNHSQGLEHYAKILQEKPYTYEDHIAPHDIKVREWGGDGKTRYEMARDLGVRFRLARNVSVIDGIQAVRAMLPKCVFNEKKCDHLLQALREYTKERDHLGEFRNKPKHDWCSHPCDAMRYLAVGLRKERPKYDAKQPEVAVV